MSNFATGVTVVTTIDDHGSLHGMTANSFTSVSLNPPIVLICVDLNTNTHGFIKTRGAFGVNILSDRQGEIGEYFARPPQIRSGKVPYSHQQSENGLPQIRGCLAFLGCQVIDAKLYNDHTVFVGKVDEISLGDTDNPLIFYKSRFRLLQRDLEGQSNC